MPSVSGWISKRILQCEETHFQNGSVEKLHPIHILLQIMYLYIHSMQGLTTQVFQ